MPASANSGRNWVDFPAHEFSNLEDTTLEFATPDLCDEHAGIIQVVRGLHWRSYGGRTRFAGPIATVKCFEDNSRVKQTLAGPGNGRVLVVDGGGSLRNALIGDMIARNACDNGWAGVVINGVCRDVEILAEIEIGIHALGSVPIKSVRRDEGQAGLPVEFGGVRFETGHHVYVDANGIVVSPRALV